MTTQTPLEHFKAVLTGTARAMAHEPEVELAFTADVPTQVGKNFRVPMPGRNLPREQVAEARGFADAMALRLRHHDSKIHAANCPTEPVAAACFDAIEGARIEALGARAMAGVRANLSHALEMKMRSDPISRARALDEVPISTALGLMVRRALTGDAPPECALTGLDHISGWIDENAGAHIEGLELLIDDQVAFAQQVWETLKSLDLVQSDDAQEPTDDSGEEDEPDDADADSDDTDDDDGGDSDAQPSRWNRRPIWMRTANPAMRAKRG
jgi:cobaltochelatase CobT